MDELLKETLKDFDFSDTASDARAAETSRPYEATASRGPSLPPKKSKPGGSDSKAKPSTSGLSHTSSATSSSHMPSLPTRKMKATPSSDPELDKLRASLPPEVQKLADDLLKLIEESGVVDDEVAKSAKNVLDSSEEPFGGLSPSQFSSATLKSMAERAKQVTEELEAPGSRLQHASSSSSSAALVSDRDAQDEETFTSAALKGLAEQTKETVNKQSKYARGEGPSQQRQRPVGGLPGGGLPFGDILGALGGTEGGGGMGFMVDYIMQNLLSKEVLYQPLKEICEQYPPWLEANEGKLSAEDVQRYKLQHSSIQAVCKQYEDDPSNFKQLVDLIQKMQAYGDPPRDIVDEMTGGMPSALMGGSGEVRDTGLGMDDLDLPEEFANLPKELQDKCILQ
ncbi:hypothetical protein CEUSTIGMA_g8040.t1 [Chlamydomonas eustigma]|uniref:Peroxin-19 n=1 Tax=Chlamydomonas eustigma TaxID=1157962 RepID=A0A250XBZ1_9CHLO|nr:hypothetical protein CEUSTIGMA_g8040.t1 [Chlamydomonas eustigma]|eukprot:GAX80605.1 hypothetical protein CEUSTIGMA_g8040.t1 [Chlamydomonas eustigma]